MLAARRRRPAHRLLSCSTGWGWRIARTTTPAELSGRVSSSARRDCSRAGHGIRRSCAPDELTSALDPELVGEVLQVMKDLAASGMTMAGHSRDRVCLRGRRSGGLHDG